MRRLRALLVGFGLSGLGIAACGETLNIDEPEVGDASPPAEAGDAALETSGAEDAGADAVADAREEDVAQPPLPATNPGAVTCFGADCVQTQVCCMGTDRDAGVCAGQTSCTFGIFSCDEAADCEGDQVCLLTGGSAPTGSACGMPDTTSAERCRGTEGCAKGVPCKFTTCGGLQFFTCGGKCP